MLFLIGLLNLCFDIDLFPGLILNILHTRRPGLLLENVAELFRLEIRLLVDKRPNLDLRALFSKSLIKVASFANARFFQCKLILRVVAEGADLAHEGVSVDLLF